MRHLFTATLLAMALMLPSAYAASHTTPCYFDGHTFNVDSGCTLNVLSGGTLSLATGATESNSAAKTTGGSTDVSGVVFSTAITGNPLMQQTAQNVLVSSVGLTSTALFPILASTSGKTIYPNGALTIMVSGTAATATGLALECGDGTLLVSWPINELINQIPVGIYASAGTAVGAGVTKGCPASKGIYLSNIGTLITTTTNVFVNLPYTVQ